MTHEENRILSTTGEYSSEKFPKSKVKTWHSIIQNLNPQKIKLVGDGKIWSRRFFIHGIDILQPRYLHVGIYVAF